MIHPNRKMQRSGATMLEGAIILSVFLLLIFGIIDIGLGIFRFNLLSAAARHGARQCIVHGEYAPTGWNGGPWGTSTIDVSADTTGNYIVDAITPMLVHCDLSKSKVKVEWTDSSNNLEKNVRVTVTSSYTPIFSGFFGASFNLTASSTMQIAH